jgi:hypothetical protein
MSRSKQAALNRCLAEVVVRLSPPAGVPENVLKRGQKNDIGSDI